MISIAALIYRSTRYADAVWNSAHKHTPHLKDGRARFFFVANDPTDEVLAHLKAQRRPHVIQRNAKVSDEELDRLGFSPPEYIRRVYQGWNRAIKESEEEMVLVNSDIMFSDGWLDALLAVARPDRAVASQLVERKHPKHGSFWSAYAVNFGDHPARFDAQGFGLFVAATRQRAIRTSGAYSPIMLRRSKAIEAGLYPEGNIRRPEKRGMVLRYGDQDFFLRLAKIGVEHVTALDSLVYHFKEGEMSE